MLLKQIFLTFLFSALLTIGAGGQELKGIAVDGHRNRLIAINVNIKGTAIQAITQGCGQFSIPINSDEFTLAFHGMTYDDFRTYEIKLKKAELTNDTIIFQLGHLKAENPICRKVERKLKRRLIE